MSKRSKLAILCEIEGFEDSEAMAEAYICDSICPAICMTEGCDYTAHYEPDCQDGYCDECGGQTMQSAMILMGII